MAPTEQPQQQQDDGDATVCFKYVFIPADTTQDIEERAFACPKRDEVLAFINALKRHFKAAGAPSSSSGGSGNGSGSGTVDDAARHAAFKAALGDKAAGVDEGLLRALSGTQMVEPIALVANAPATGFVGVYMYCDDQASLKRLPPNPRATALAGAAGLALQVAGDAFLGRYFDDEEGFERRDFTLRDLSSDAPWVREAQAQLARRSERSGDAQALLQRLQQQQPQQVGGGAQRAAAAGAAGAAAAAEAPSSPADAEKARGNAALRGGDLQAALEHYTAALKLDPSNVAARNNRALAYLKLARHADAAADASAVLARDPTNAKALLRRAAAALGAGQPGARAAAAADYEAVLRLEPQNPEARARLAELKAEGEGEEGAAAAEAAAGAGPAGAVAAVGGGEGGAAEA